MKDQQIQPGSISACTPVLFPPRSTATPIRWLGLLLLALLLPHQVARAGEAPVNLGSAANFGALAGSTVTSIGATILSGDLGLWPGTAVSGFPPGVVIGTMQVNNPIAMAAQGDLTTAFIDAAGRATAPALVAGNIGGQTLPPGLYRSTSTLAISSGELTLDGQGDANAVFIFQVASSLDVTSGRQVILINGAQAGNVFWQVGTSASIGTTAAMKGTILADQSISIATGAVLEGRALARIAAVTLQGNIISVPILAGAVPEIAVEQPVGANIGDGGSKDFGVVALGANADLVFTIKNTGIADLTGLNITIDGVDSANFTVTIPASAPVSGPLGTTTFTVRFAPLTVGPKTAALHIANNDANENPFDIVLTGGFPEPVLTAVATSPLMLNPQTGLYEQTVRVTNTGLVTAPGIQLSLQGLPADVVVNTASGTTAGTPFIEYAVPLAAGAFVDFMIEYRRSNRAAIPQPTFVALSVTLSPQVVSGMVITVNRSLQLASGRFLIEFNATPGGTYVVQYSSDLVTWKTALPVITALSNREQWYDDGPPKTESLPTALNTRFYRVLVQTQP